MLVDILKYLYYKDGWLHWKETIHNKCQKDSKAGTIKQNGYVEIQYQRQRYYAHRLIWIIFNGIIPDNFVINHKDGNPTNNKVENLECVEHVVNLHLYRKLTRNTSGVRGVSKCSLTGRWDASIRFKGQDYRKSFNTIEEATEFVNTMRKTLIQSCCQKVG